MNTRIFKRALVAVTLPSALFVAALGSHAYALTPEPDQNRTPPIRQLNQQATNTIRFDVNWNDPNISGGVLLPMALPANAYVLAIDAYVGTAFNAGTTNVVTLGVTKTSANEIVASGITAGSTGIYHLTSAAGLGLAVTSNTSDQLGGGSVPAYVPIYAKYAQTGTAATAGKVTIVVTYIPDNDLH